MDWESPEKRGVWQARPPNTPFFGASSIELRKSKVCDFIFTSRLS